MAFYRLPVVGKRADPCMSIMVATFKIALPGAGHVDVAQIGPSEIGTVQVCVAEVGPDQVGANQDRRLSSLAREVDLAHVGTDQSRCR